MPEEGPPGPRVRGRTFVLRLGWRGVELLAACRPSPTGTGAFLFRTFGGFLHVPTTQIYCLTGLFQTAVPAHVWRAADQGETFSGAVLCVWQGEIYDAGHAFSPLFLVELAAGIKINP
jgi:hypothetical protein